MNREQQRLERQRSSSKDGAAAATTGEENRWCHTVPRGPEISSGRASAAPLRIFIVFKTFFCLNACNFFYWMLGGNDELYTCDMAHVCTSDGKNNCTPRLFRKA